jgi:hypothetical protein
MKNRTFANCFTLALGVGFFLIAGAALAADPMDDVSDDVTDEVTDEVTDDVSSHESEIMMEEKYDDGWEYDPYYIFGLTRHMSDSGLPLAGQIALYPFAFVIDLGQWPIGALAGLAGK